MNNGRSVSCGKGQFWALGLTADSSDHAVALHSNSKRGIGGINYHDDVTTFKSVSPELKGCGH